MKPIPVRSLGELSGIFARLETGKTVCLGSPGRAQNGPGVLPARPSLGMYTSGSTGEPKLIWHDWVALKRNVSCAKKYRGWTWASPFKPWTFAGVQVALQAWATSGRMVDLDGNWRAAWSALVRRKIEAIACTPTYADLLIQHEPGSGFNHYAPKQMTLGGEVLRAALGGRIRRRFPHTRFTVIYATTELGVIMKTNRLDGWYEVGSLGQEFSRWRVGGQGSEVSLPAVASSRRREVRGQRSEVPPTSSKHFVAALSRNQTSARRAVPFARALAEGETALCEGGRTEVSGVLEVWRGRQWHNTNDQVELSEDLIRVIGRHDRVANVAGYKVSLAEVEELAEQVPGIRHASAVSEPNAITGEIVALHYSSEPGSDEAVVRAALQARLRKQLRKEAWPRRWQRAHVGMGPNAKRVARGLNTKIAKATKKN